MKISFQISVDSPLKSPSHYNMFRFIHFFKEKKLLQYKIKKTFILLYINFIDNVNFVNSTIF